MVWLFIGTLFYSYSMNLGWSKGFYMAVNVGYSIGWGYPSEFSDESRVFSTFYVLVGASAVAASLGYFAQAMIDSSKRWYAVKRWRNKSLSIQHRKRSFTCGLSYTKGH